MRVILASLACVLLGAAPGSASSLLVWSDTLFQTSPGSGLLPSQDASTVFDAAFDTVNAVNGLTNASDFNGIDALIVGPVSPTVRLPAAARSNIESFVQAGGRALFVGEWLGWSFWNGDILDIVGAGFAQGNLGNGNQEIATVLQTHPLTAGVTEIRLDVFSDVVPGTEAPDFLFSSEGVALYQYGLGEILYVMDSNPFGDEIGTNGNNIAAVDNRQFVTNIATWLAGPEIPAPGMTAMLLLAVAGLAARRAAARPDG